MIEFKYPGLRREFEGEPSAEGFRLHPGLRIIAFALAGYADYRWRKNIVITEILRSQTRQDEYYAGNPLYRVNPWKSVHQFGCGLDIRCWNFSPAEIVAMLDFINTNFHYDGENSHQVALYHDISRGKHLHLQVSLDTPLT